MTSTETLMYPCAVLFPHARRPQALGVATLVGLLFLTLVTATAVEAAGWDLNFDGKSDIVWRNLATNEMAIWLMNGTVAGPIAALPVVDPTWSLVGVADFTGDHKADFLWKNTDGTVGIWAMDGTAIAGTFFVGVAPAGLTVAGVGDVDGDGDPDIVFRNTTTGEVVIWIMNGTALESTATLPVVPGLDWTLVQVADLDHDGKADLLWRNTSGEVAVWLLNGSTVTSFVSLGTAPLDWTIVGVGDFDGDLHPDILWRQTGGTLGIWFVGATGTTIASTAIVGPVTTDWAVVGVRDFDGDGKADILWRRDDGTVAIWLMNGAAVGSAAVVGAPSIDWVVSRVEPFHWPTITSPNTATFKVGVADTFIVTTMGFPDPALTRGGVALPTGVNFVDNGNGTGTLSGTPDPGTGGTYALSFTANNGIAPNSIQNPFTLTVKSPATDISLSPSTVAENQPINTVVGTLSATDPDAGDTQTFSLVAGTGSTDNGSFNISGTQLRTSASLDFEAGSSRSIRVRATDSFGLIFEKPLTVTVTNVNEAPTDIGLSPSSVAENQPVNTVVGSFSATDPDAGDTFTFTLVGGTGSTDNASFNINGNQLQTSVSFNFEAGSSKSIRVRATDSGSLTFEKALTVTVTNVNEAPTDIALSPSNVNENQPVNTVVGSFSTTDPDAGDTFTYTLVSGTGSTDNASFNISGNQLQTSASFDFETKNSYSIRVRSTDAGTLFTEKQFTITVNNVNEAPTDIGLSSTSVNENQPVNTVVGTLTATDPDNPGAGQTHTFSLVGGNPDNASFNISTNQLRTSASFNFETKSSYSIMIRATDNGTPNLSFDKAFTISVGNLNDPPVAVDHNYGANSAQANMKISVPALTGLLAGATDEDATPVQVLSVSQADISATNPAGGVVTVNADGSFDFEPPPGVTGNVTFTYKVCDDGAGFGGAPGKQCSAAKTVTFNVATPVIWFVDVTNGSDSNNGTLSHPFQSMTKVATVDAANHRIFVYTGTHGIGIALNSGEWLIGQGATSSPLNTFDELMGITPPAGTVARPSIGGTRPTLQGTVTLETNARVQGLNLSTSGSTGITDPVAAITGVTVKEVAVTTTTGTAVSLSNIAGTLTFTGVTTGGGTGVNLTGSNGSATFDFSAVSISSGGNPGFAATGGGTVNVTGSSNTVTSTTGTAVSLNGTGGALTFTSVSAGTGAGGPANGISLTSTTGSFTVTGDGASARNNSGGTIQHTTGNSVNLITAQNVSLSRMNIHDSAAQGIFGTNVNGFIADWCNFSNNGNTNAGSGEGAMFFGDPVDNTKNGLVGTASGGANPTRISNNDFASSAATHIRIDNSSGTLTQLDVKKNTFTGLGSSPPAGTGGGGLQVEIRGSAGATLKMTGNAFTSNFGAALQGTALGQSSLTFNVLGATPDGANTFTNNGADALLVSNKDDADLTTEISSNTFTGNPGNAIFIGNGIPPVSSSSSINGKILNNTITQPAVPTSVNHVVLAVFSGTAAPSSVQICGNNVTNNGNFDGINVNTPDSGTSPNFNVIANNNTVNNAASASNAINLNGRQSSTALFHAQGNTTTTSVGIGVQVRQVSPATVNLERGISASGVASTVLSDNNPAAAGAPGTFVTGTVGVVNNTLPACSSPTTN